MHPSHPFNCRFPEPRSEVPFRSVPFHRSSKLGNPCRITVETLCCACPRLKVPPVWRVAALG
jgi:hypothetical protein